MQLNMILTLYLTAVALSTPALGNLEYAFYPIKDSFLTTESVLFRFSLTNYYESGILFLPWTTPLDFGPGQILQLTRDGAEVRFIGPVASRLPPSAEDYVLLPAGGYISVPYNVSGAYEVDGRAGNYIGNMSIYLSAKRIVSATINYDSDTFSLTKLSITNISFCVVESVTDVCNLPPNTPGDMSFNTTVLSHSSVLLPYSTLVCVVLMAVYVFVSVMT